MRNRSNEVKTTPYRELKDLLQRLDKHPNKEYTKGVYTIAGGELTAKRHAHHWEDEGGIVTHLIAQKVGRNIFINTAETELARTEHVGGHAYNLSKIQQLTENENDKKYVRIPFNLSIGGDGSWNNDIEELDLSKVKMVARGKAVNGKRIKEDKIHAIVAGGKSQRITDCEDFHFVGALLFTLGERSFLMDIDRLEIKKNLYNLFLCEVPGKPKTIKAAYASLMPKRIENLIAKGIKVKRQGEYYLVPSPSKQKQSDSGDYVDYSHDLGNHSGEYIVVIKNKIFTKGNFMHNNAEHMPIDLEQWHEVVENKAIASHNIEGDVD